MIELLSSGESQRLCSSESYLQVIRCGTRVGIGIHMSFANATHLVASAHDRSEYSSLSIKLRRTCKADINLTSEVECEVCNC